MASTNVPAELKYTADHEWARQEGDLWVIGITYYAQQLLGDVVYVDLGSVGDVLKSSATFGVVESVKAASDLFAPLSGEIVEVNQELVAEPDMVNSDPYTDGWMIKVRPSDASEIAGLMDAAAYEALLGKMED